MCLWTVSILKWVLLCCWTADESTDGVVWRWGSSRKWHGRRYQSHRSSPAAHYTLQSNCPDGKQVCPCAFLLLFSWWKDQWCKKSIFVNYWSNSSQLNLLTFLLNTKQKHRVFSKALKYVIVKLIISFSFSIITRSFNYSWVFRYLWPWAVRNLKTNEFITAYMLLVVLLDRATLNYLSLRIRKPSVRVWWVATADMRSARFRLWWFAQHVWCSWADADARHSGRSEGATAPSHLKCWTH